MRGTVCIREGTPDGRCTPDAVQVWDNTEGPGVWSRAANTHVHEGGTGQRGWPGRAEGVARQGSTPCSVAAVSEAAPPSGAPRSRRECCSAGRLSSGR